MTIRNSSMAFLAAIFSFFLASAALAQAAPAIRSFSVDQVAQLTPGTELIFRVGGTAGGTLTMQLDGVASIIGLTETRGGVYEGAYTISVRDKITYASKALATLKLGNLSTQANLNQTLLTPEAHAKAAPPPPAPALAINRFETKNSGALTGGHEINFIVEGTPGAKASVTTDGGKTSMVLIEEKAGHYVGAYTVKTRDQFSEATQTVATLSMGDKKTTLGKTLAVGAITPKAVAVADAKCLECGVVQSVSTVNVKGKPNYIGAIAGGVAGAALGSQVGKGDGNTAATVVGAVGGAVAGREIEKRVRSSTRYDVVVKLNNGTQKTVSFEAEPGFKAGSRVKLSGETLVSNE